ncbi:CPBP family intramembrane glutamic endopeptidase [Planctomyces sp. SH-PL62]|uniref:CPBP family intramembrane glutamic endopeptidase n=1 Tax=Planctomyces sp. SH-PL62 TaxID=1636152 RepID=UPI00078BA581|nr:CPBP family intramembrane glutamic endopeptidase [Planctomyces sp. SH-PL62]AMV36676.1 CAAX amino terminal protease self- immunity [Planctomyces sp. SH-PL62]
MKSIKDFPDLDPKSRSADGRRKLRRLIFVEPIEDPTPGYWSTTRKPLPSLVLVAPIVLAYEFGVVWLGGSSASALRTGADAWMRQSLAAAGLTDHWLLPLSLFLILLGWQAFQPKGWKFSPMVVAGMIFESLVLAVALVGVSRLVDMGFDLMERTNPPTVLLQVPGSADGSAAQLVGYLGAGVYEEALFRLLLVPFVFYLLRGLQTPQVLSNATAVTGSALLFSLAHHAGNPGEAFTWFAFIFRWMAGVFFAWVFILRGFGIAVGAHTAYDVLVGWVGWDG